jgi:hypothetical protein
MRKNDWLPLFDQIVVNQGDWNSAGQNFPLPASETTGHRQGPQISTFRAKSIEPDDVLKRIT